MGVKHGREYREIHAEFAEAIMRIHDFYTFIEMESEDWEQLTEEDKKEIADTVADDLFYALGMDKEILVGGGKVIYDPRKHLLKIQYPSPDLIHIVKLI